MVWLPYHGLHTTAPGRRQRNLEGCVTGATAGPGPAQFGSNITLWWVEAHIVGPVANTRRPRTGRPGEPLPPFAKARPTRCGSSGSTSTAGRWLPATGKSATSMWAKLPLSARPISRRRFRGAPACSMGSASPRATPGAFICRSVVPGPAHLPGGGVKIDLTAFETRWHRNNNTHCHGRRPGHCLLTTQPDWRYRSLRPPRCWNITRHTAIWRRIAPLTLASKTGTLADGALQTRTIDHETYLECKPGRGAF